MLPLPAASSPTVTETASLTMAISTAPPVATRLVVSADRGDCSVSGSMGMSVFGLGLESLVR